MAKNIIQNKKGFTIIEMVVVVTVFLFVIGAAINIFISIVKHQKTVLSEQQLINQVSYVEEYMSKALRMAKTELDGDCTGYPGYIYLLTHYDVTSGLYGGIKFINQSGGDSFGCQEFYLDVASANDSTLVLWEKKGDSAPVALTSANLQFYPDNPVRFSINGSDGSFAGMSALGNCSDSLQCGASEADFVQPRVTVLLNVKISGDNQNSVFRAIQTTVSRRNLNVK